MAETVDSCVQNNEEENLSGFYSKYESYVWKLNRLSSGKTGELISTFLLALLLWTATLTVTKKENLPGGNLFGLFVIFSCSLSLGTIFSRLPFLQLPNLLGMLLAGLLLSNISSINVVKDVKNSWSIALRNIALVVILIRSGLELDPVALKKLKRTVILLAFIPCITEALTVTVAAQLLLHMPWLWGLQLG